MYLDFVNVTDNIVKQVVPMFYYFHLANLNFTNYEL